jgi:hypothetical protein
MCHEGYFVRDDFEFDSDQKSSLVLAAMDCDVRFGSKADISAFPPDVRFTSKSGHWLSASGCPFVPKADVGRESLAEFQWN